MRRAGDMAKTKRKVLRDCKLPPSRRADIRPPNKLDLQVTRAAELGLRTSHNTNPHF
jgi:hypothetical protein